MSEQKLSKEISSIQSKDLRASVKMPFEIKNKCLYSDSGDFLKEVYCPRAVENEDLTPNSEGHFQCSKCDHLVLNTDLMTEKEIVRRLQDEPKACLKINLANPLFCVSEIE